MTSSRNAFLREGGHPLKIYQRYGMGSRVRSADGPETCKVMIRHPNRRDSGRHGTMMRTPRNKNVHLQLGNGMNKYGQILSVDLD